MLKKKISNILHSGNLNHLLEGPAVIHPVVVAHKQIKKDPRKLPHRGDYS